MRNPGQGAPVRALILARAWRAGEDQAILGGDVARVEAVLDAWGIACEGGLRTGHVAPLADVLGAWEMAPGATRGGVRSRTGRSCTWWMARGAWRVRPQAARR